jgi:hypothetical protein
VLHPRRNDRLQIGWKNALAFLIFINCSASVALARWLQNDYGQAKPNQQRNQLHQVLRPRLHEAMISHYAVIRVYDDAGNVIQTHEQAGDFKHWWGSTLYRAPFFLACLADLRSSFWQSRFS